MEVGIWNIPRLYFQHKEGSLQRVGPWNIPDPGFHESGIFHGSTSNTKKAPCSKTCLDSVDQELR